MVSFKKMPPADRLRAVAGDAAFAVCIVGAAFAVRSLLGLAGPGILIFALCYPAILAATLIRGRLAGIFALVLSVLLFWWAFVPPAYSLLLLTLVDTLNVLLFAGAGAAIIWISQLYRRTVIDLQAERARSELLLAEMGHRAKNGIAVISAIVKHSLPHDPDAADKIIGRIMTLKKADDLLLEQNQSSLGLEDLLQRELSTYDLSRVGLSGPRTELNGELVRTFSMVVHELATNAAKYGAWSVPSGTIDIRWGRSVGQTSFEWEERGCPPPEERPKPGFGSLLVDRLLAQHHGRAEFERRPSGIYWRLTLPEEANVGPRPTSSAAGGPETSMGISRRDNPILAPGRSTCDWRHP